MKIRETLKKCVWTMLTIVISYLMIQTGYDASGNIWITGDPTFHYYVALIREILTGIAIFVPVWLLTLLGLARCYLGENWFPFAEKIPIRVTKIVLVAALILLIGVSVAGAVYSEYTEAPYHIQYMMEKRFEGLQVAFAWVLFYSVLLYIEQWCIRRHDSRQIIRKKQIWATVLIIMTRIILLEIECVHLWYIPLSYVDCPNDLEDYYLWWFSLCSAVFLLPFWFFSARKTIRLFINNAQWLTLTTIVPRKIAALTALVATGLMAWQIQESRDWNSWIEIADVPEYGEAAAMAHGFQALIWGLMLFFILCLLVKQMWVAHIEKHRL